MCDSLSELSLRNDAVVFDVSEAARTGFVRFCACETQSFRLKAGGDGWIEFSRHRRGDITVRYRISSWDAAAALEGEVCISGEFSAGLLREFGALVEER